MRFNKKKFIETLFDDFNETFTIEEIKKIIDYDDDYLKDTPISTGKRLYIDKLIFNGIKKDGSKIDFEHKFKGGINFIIADNLKGKSSILKIITFALTGNNKLEKDIKDWIKEILLNIKIGNNDYAIYIDCRQRSLDGRLLSTHVNSISEIEKYNDRIVISEKGKNFATDIEMFFFKQFSYYPLQWTQKSSNKQSNDLITSNASWKTYFKSIYLESSDSNSLMYGSQSQKLFQMLLGLQLTYPINKLSIKQDQLEHSIINEKEYISRNSNIEDIDELKADLLKLSTEISSKSNRHEDSRNIDLSQEYSKLISELNIIEKHELELRKKLKELNDTKVKTINDNQIKKQELNELNSNKNHLKKKINDIKEYIEIGSLFSNLDISICPACDKEVKPSMNQHSCTLCGESIDESAYIIDKELFTSKIVQHEESIQLLNSNISVIEDDISKSAKELADIDDKLIEIKNDNKYEGRINKLFEEIETIQKELITVSKTKLDIAIEKEKLIKEQAIIEYKISIYEEDKSQRLSTMEKKLELYKKAIENLKESRLNNSSQILKDFSELILNEIHKLGLTSISKVNVTDNFDIKFIKNDLLVTFNDITDGEKLRSKLAFYLGLIQLDITKSFGRHTKYLMIDSPSKEEGDSNYLDGLSDIFIDIENRLGNELQIIIGTAERSFEGLIKNQLIIPKDQYVF